MADIDEELVGLRGDDRIVQQARLRFKRCEDWYGEAYKNCLEDEKFANGDPRNRFQWPQGVYDDRARAEGGERPCLTINKVRIHNDIIINEAMKNRASIKVRPTGGRASYEASQVMQSIIRRIEYISKASVSYNTCFTKQIDGGLGYIFIETAYVNEKSFDQDIYIRGCRDPRTVYLDPDIREPDGSDAGFGFIFEDLSRETFNQRYRKFKNKIGKSTLGKDTGWLDDDHVRVATCYRKNGEDDTFVSYVEANSGQRIEKLASEIERDSGGLILDALLAQIAAGEIDGRTRDVINQKVEWFLIAGDLVVDRGDWPGKYIPICRCVGRETIIDGKVEIKGHTRALIDSQRMLNYNASGQVEFGALQTKSPYIGAAAAFEGQEEWKDVNRKNYSFMQFNHQDDDGKDLPPQALPRRNDPPQSAPVYMEGAMSAERWMMMASGQYQEKLGESSKQTAESGKAISARQAQGDTSTYHYVEHQGDMLRFIGIQLLDLIPKIYDTQRTLHILGEDGTKRWIAINPTQTDAIQELKKEGDEAAELSFNPSIGEYDCMSDPGPNYATQRQEAWNAIAIILQQNMELAGTIGDLLFKFGDFPGADEIMDRLRKEIQNSKPYLFGEQEPGFAAMQAKLQELQALNGELMQKLAEMQLKLLGREQKRDIEAHRAESERIDKASAAWERLSTLPGTAQELQSLIHQAVGDALNTHITELVKANSADIGDPASDRQ